MDHLLRTIRLLFGSGALSWLRTRGKSFGPLMKHTGEEQQLTLSMVRQTYTYQACAWIRQGLTYMVRISVMSTTGTPTWDHNGLQIL